MKKLLSASKVIETRLLPRPSRNTLFKFQRRAKTGARLEARIAWTTWGKNIAPYWELPNPQPCESGLVKWNWRPGK
jgi:hypothetical protein